MNIFAQCSTRSKDDKVGVLLYGVKEKQNPNNFDGIRLLHDLDRPSAFWLIFFAEMVEICQDACYYNQEMLKGDGL